MAEDDSLKATDDQLKVTEDPSATLTTPMDDSIEASPPSHDHTSALLHTSDEKNGESSNLPITSASGHNCRVPDGILSQHQPQLDRNNSLQPPSSVLQGLQMPQEANTTSVPGQGKPPGVFAMPQVPPRRFTMPKPLDLSQKPADTTEASNSVNISVAGTVNTLTSATTCSSAASTPSVIPPAFQLRSPKPPLSSPKPTSGGKTTFSFELPKFSIPPCYKHEAVASSSTPSQLPSSFTQSTASGAPQTGGLAQKASTQNVTSSLKPSSVGQSVSAQYRLKMPPKPALPCPPSFTAPIPSVQPPKTFTLPRLSQLPTRSPVQQKQQPQAQQHLPGSGTLPQETNSHSTFPAAQKRIPTSNSNSLDVNAVEPSPLVSTTPQESRHREQQKQYKTTQEQALEYQQHLQNYQQYIYQQETQQQQSPETQMDVSTVSDELVEGGEGGGEMDGSFNPASTSIDFGEHSVDFDSSGLFALPADDIVSAILHRVKMYHAQPHTLSQFNMPQTEPLSFFNQDTTQCGKQPISNP